MRVTMAVVRENYNCVKKEFHRAATHTANLESRPCFTPLCQEGAVRSKVGARLHGSGRVPMEMTPTAPAPSSSNELQSNKASASDDQESDLRLRRWPQPITSQKRSPMLLLVFLLVGFASGILMGVFVIAAHADQACPSGVQLQQEPQHQPSAAGESSGRSAWPPFRDATLPASARAWDLITRLTLEEKAALLTFDSYMVERLGGTQFDGGVQSMRG